MQLGMHLIGLVSHTMQMHGFPRVTLQQVGMAPLVSQVPLPEALDPFPRPLAHFLSALYTLPHRQDHFLNHSTHFLGH